MTNYVAASSAGEASQRVFIIIGMTVTPRRIDNDAGNVTLWEFDMPPLSGYSQAPYQYKSILTHDERTALGKLVQEFQYDYHLWQRIVLFLANLPNQKRFRAKTYLNVNAIAIQLYSWVVNNTQKN